MTDKQHGNSKWPGDAKADEIVRAIGSNGGGKAAMAAKLKISHQTMLRWMDPEDPAYKGERFCEAVREALTEGQAKLMAKAEAHMVEEPGEAKINLGVLKFIAQHKYGLTDKTQVEQTGNQSIQINIDKDEADL